MFGRFTKHLLVAFGLLMATLAATSATASGQGNDATLDVVVRYPNGQLVTDTDVCANYYAADSNGLQGFFASTRGAESSLAVPSGGQYAISVGGCTVTATGLKTRTWHNGQPVGDRFSNTLRVQLLVNELINPTPGANSIEIVVGESRLSGEVTGADPNSCFVTISGTDRAASTWGPAQFLSVQPDGSWEAWVLPGTYTAEVSCSLRSAYEAWPNKAMLGDATPITVANKASPTGINFDLSDRYNESTGSLLFLNFETTEQYNLPKCVEAYTLDGTLVSRRFRSSVSTANNGSYQLKIADCFGLGFGDSWYNDAATAADAQVLVVDGSLVETNLADVKLGGPGYFDCNGEEITIRGTAGADDLRGTAGRDVISGLGGNDTITALGGDDVICGGDGNDRILGNAGADWIDAGAGDDWVGAGWGDDTIYGGAGNDFIRAFKHDDFVDGGPGADRIKGGWGNDVLRGGADNDIILGYFGADVLYGDGGNDVLRAGNGPDILTGGPGPADRLYGDQGRDDCRDVGAQTVFADCLRINGD